MDQINKKFNTIKIISYLAFIAMVVINILADTIPFNNTTIEGISNKYNNPFTPADYTFSIWGIIYFALAAYLIYQSGLLKKWGLFPKISQHSIAKININFIISSFTLIIWIFTWHYDLILLSTILMVLLLVLLINIAVTIFREHIGLMDYIFVKAPFSLFFGWVTIATFANIVTWFVSIGWNGFGLSAQFWTIFVLILATIIGLFVILRLNDIGYGLVYHWAIIGILVRHTRVLNNYYTGIVVTLVISLILLFTSVVYLVIKALKDKNKFTDAVKNQVRVKR